MMDIKPYFREGHDPGDEDARQAIVDEFNRCKKDPEYCLRNYTSIRTDDGVRKLTELEIQQYLTWIRART